VDGFTGLLHESEMRREEGAPAFKEGDELTVVVASIRGDKVALSQRSAEEINQVGAGAAGCRG
jgi:ribosomal protein S1